jgi:hypothetical protein
MLMVMYQLVSLLQIPQENSSVVKRLRMNRQIQKDGRRTFHSAPHSEFLLNYVSALIKNYHVSIITHILGLINLFLYVPNEICSCSVCRVKKELSACGAETLTEK